jgi:hypothetical protein
MWFLLGSVGGVIKVGSNKSYCGFRDDIDCIVYWVKQKAKEEELCVVSYVNEEEVCVVSYVFV